MFKSIEILQLYVGHYITPSVIQNLSQLTNLTQNYLLDFFKNENRNISTQYDSSAVYQFKFTQYQLLKYAYLLEGLSSQKFNNIMHTYLYKKLGNNQLQQISQQMELNRIAVKFLLYFVQFQRFPQSLDFMLRTAVDNNKIGELLVNLEKLKGIQAIFTKWRIGSLYNINLFNHLELIDIENQSGLVLVPINMSKLLNIGADVRFAQQLSNFYQGQQEIFWGFPRTDTIDI
ncbi:hypothetical protein SS50377_25745 [Spironucleus salmonicida]|uniref:Uncharacterized protein n=1 Tax=Spironucleus salmonicida TaxID=348837 RepID=V6LVK9_9EUKA|nr:hypothetical protein SS50377_25745 [Spironucleus salmonicida]|eukprot:EST48278.1 Hypothetical protein SS50377_11619 [Spironucleus salmonicida]